MSIRRSSYLIVALLNLSLLSPVLSWGADRASSPSEEEDRQSYLDEMGYPITASELLGKRVKDAKGNDIGKIENMIVSRTGRVTHALVAFGGFLDIGKDVLPIPWAVFDVNQKFVVKKEDSPLYLKVTKEKLQDAPRMRPFLHPLPTANVSLLTQADRYFADEISARHEEWKREYPKSGSQ